MGILVKDLSPWGMEMGEEMSPASVRENPNDKIFSS
jgi:hypothetical protein